MRKVVFFMMTTLNGLYERGRWDVDPTGLDWHNTDDEFETFAADQLGEADTILFGRVTYEGMATYWPTPEALAADPAVAEQMNALEKVVFSRTLREPLAWDNSRLANADLVEEVRRLKAKSDAPLRTIGSLSVVKALLEAGPVDGLRLMVSPQILGNTGREPIFEGLPDIDLELAGTDVLDGRLVALEYRPANANPVG